MQLVRTETQGQVGLAAVPPPSLARWTLLCAAAEAVGMAAAAAAAKTSQLWTGGASGASRFGVVLSLAVAGGLVEGAVLGIAQSMGLSAWLGRRERIRWVLVTLAVAGIGWAAASAPAARADDSGEAPGVALVLLGSVGLGMAMGAMLGGAQAFVVRNVVGLRVRGVTSGRALRASSRSGPVDLGDLATNDRDLMLPDGIGVPDSVPGFPE